MARVRLTIDIQSHFKPLASNDTINKHLKVFLDALEADGVTATKVRYKLKRNKREHLPPPLGIWI